MTEESTKFIDNLNKLMIFIQYIEIIPFNSPMLP